MEAINHRAAAGCNHTSPSESRSPGSAAATLPLHRARQTRSSEACRGHGGFSCRLATHPHPAGLCPSPGRPPLCHLPWVLLEQRTAQSGQGVRLRGPRVGCTLLGFPEAAGTLGASSLPS